VKPFSPAKSIFARSTTPRTLLALVAVAALAPAVAAEAAPPPAAASAPAPGKAGSMEGVQKIHTEYMNLQQRLAQIQQKTMQAHPELQKQEKAFMDLMLSKMSTGGTSGKAQMDALHELEEKLSNKSTPADERKTLMSEYQQKMTAFRTAQMQAMKDPEVQKAQESLMKATVAAMKKEDPQTEQLMQQIEQKQEQLKTMMESAGHGQ
jgi:chromosome segregation ATPase